MRAARRKKHAAGPPSGAHLPSARPPGAETPWAAALRPRALSRHQDPRGAAHVAGREPGHVRQEAGLRSDPSQEFGLIRAGPSAPFPRSAPKSFPAASTIRGTCRSSSRRYHTAKNRETSQLIARDFPHYGALEGARDGAQALLLAAPRARSSENRP